ncbi:MAG: UvrD-helicase domain-containing protein [Akkermansia sp.]|nr:UvrD-helicase domain-containing protein [Akkermansia sp.]
MSEPSHPLCFHTTSTRISASAGTGKTYQLASRYIALLMLGAEPESIIALTFTTKAAGEFRSRILHALAEGACDVKDKKTGRNKTAARVWDAWSGCAQDAERKLVPAANDIPLLPATRPVVKRAAAEGLYPEELYEKDQELQDYLLLPQTTAKTFADLLKKTVKVLSKLELATIDSFFNTLVTDSCLELGVDTVSAQDPADAPLVRRQTINDYLEPRTSDETKRGDFLRMFADLARREGCRAISKLEHELDEKYLDLYRDVRDGSAWGNTDYFESKCTDENKPLTALDDKAAEQWDADVAELRFLLKDHEGSYYPHNVFSGLNKLVNQVFHVSNDLRRWVERDIHYDESLNRLVLIAKELVEAYANGNADVGIPPEAADLVEHSDWSKTDRDAFNSLCKKLGKGDFKATKTLDEFRTRVHAMQERDVSILKEMGVIHEKAIPLCRDFPAKCLHDTKARTRSLYSLLRDYSATYEQRIMTTGEFSFSDIARKARELMNQLAQEPLAKDDGSEPNKYFCREHLALRMGRKYQHWMLDEFQDTSDDQFATLAPVLECLALEAAAGETVFTQDFPHQLPASLRPYHEDARHCVGGGSIFVVGDEKQGIYGFRTGETRAFSKLVTEETWHTPVQNAALNKSFRSARAIMGQEGFVNELFRALNKVEEVDAKGNAVALGDFTRHNTTVDADGYVELKVIGEQPEETDSDAEPDGGEGNKELSEDAYEAIAQVLERLTEDGKAPRNNISIAVLTRSNKEADGVVDYLRTRMPELPVLLVKESLAAASTPLGEMMHHFFRWLLHPRDEFSAALVRASFMGKLMAADESDAAAWKRWREYLDDNGYAATVKRLQGALSDDMSEENREVLVTWLNAARNFDAEGGTPAMWEHRIATLSMQGVGSARYVQVMTMHKSKGLEFDAVILPFTAKGAIDATGGMPCFCSPDGKSLLLRPGKPDDCENCWPGAFTEQIRQWKKFSSQQEYNLLYVAITRAKYANYIILHNADISSKKAANNSSKKAASRSIGGLLRRALSIENVKTWGDENWLDSIEDKGADDDSPAGASASLGASVPRRARVSPSRLADGGGEAAAVKWRKGNSGGTDGAARLGTELHALMERVEWWEPGQPIPIPDDGSKAAKLARAVFDAPQVAAIFHRSPGAEVYNEQHVESLWEHGGEVWTSGTIDRLVLTYEGNKVVSAHIYDYKTNVRDRNADEQAQDAALKAEYKGQMEAYRDLMMAAFDLPADAVQATLVSCPSNGDAPRLIPAL